MVRLRMQPSQMGRIMTSPDNPTYQEQSPSPDNRESHNADTGRGIKYWPFRCELCGGTPGEHRHWRNPPPGAVNPVYAAQPKLGWPRHRVIGTYCPLVKRPSP